MSSWTEDEFNQVSKLTQLSNRTLGACKDVLVNGLSGVEAAAKYSILPAQVSRGLKGLRERQEKFNEIVEKRLIQKDILKSNVVQKARSMLGAKLVVKDTEAGCTYVGPTVFKQDGFLLQRVGKTGIVHDLGKLTVVPKIDANWTIEYPRDGGLASVKETPLEPARNIVQR